MKNYLEPSSKKNPNYWFYATWFFVGILTIAGLVYIIKSFSKNPVSQLITREMKVEGEVFIVTNGKESVKMGLVEICAVPENTILDWIESKENKAKIEKAKAKKALDYAQSAALQSAQNLTKAKNIEESSFKQYLDSIGSDDLRKNYAFENAKNQSRKYESIADNRKAEHEKAFLAYKYLFSPAFYFDGLTTCEAKTKTNADGKFSLSLKSKKYALAAKSQRKVFDKTEDYFWLIWVSPESLSDKPIMLTNDNLMEENPDDKVIDISIEGIQN